MFPYGILYLKVSELEVLSCYFSGNVPSKVVPCILLLFDPLSEKFWITSAVWRVSFSLPRIYFSKNTENTECDSEVFLGSVRVKGYLTSRYLGRSIFSRTGRVQSGLAHSAD